MTKQVFHFSDGSAVVGRPGQPFKVIEPKATPSIARDFAGTMAREVAERQNRFLAWTETAKQPAYLRAVK